MTFFHGSRTTNAPLYSSAKESSVAVVAVIGTAPVHSLAEGVEQRVNSIDLITKKSDAIKYYGENSVANSAYTIPRALETYFSYPNPPRVFVINVFNPATHVTDTNPDVSKVTATDIIGTQNGNVITGLQLVHTAMSKFNQKPRFVDIPKFNHESSVRIALETACALLRARTEIDADGGTAVTVQNAITYRNTEGHAWKTSSSRIGLNFPQVNMVDTSDESGYKIGGVSTELIAAWCSLIQESGKGYHYSPSNITLQNVTGLEIPLTMENTATSDVNLLNEQGITTIKSIFGGGYLAWGNRNALTPTESTLLTFKCVQLVDDIIADSLEESSRPYIDKPITKGLIEAILNMGNKFLNNLKSKGIILDGKFFFEASKNVNLSPGQLVISRKVAPCIPLEDLQFYNELVYYTNDQVINL